MNDEPLVKLYALGDIVAGKNAREEFDPVELQELADTMKATRGALQPASGWLRKDGKVELIAGERRWRAAPLAGFEKLPIMLRSEPNEREKMLWGLIENNSRVNLKPLELAKTVKALMDLRTPEGAASYTEKGLNAELGKDANFVSRCLNLLNTSPRVQLGVNAGEVCVKVAALVGSLPISCRAQAELDIIFRSWGGPMKEDEAARHVANHFRRDLRKATFDKNDATLIPGIPVCAECPNWGGRRDDVEGKNRVNICLDPGCFEEKQKAAAEVIRRHAENDPNVKVLNNGASLFNSWDDELKYDAPYVELKATPPSAMLTDPKAKTPKWEKIVEGADIKVVVAFDGKGQARRMVETKLALQAAKQSDHADLFKADAGKGVRGTDDKKLELALTKARNASHEEIVRQELGAFMECLSVPWKREHHEQLWRMILCNSQKDDLEMLCRVLQPDLKKIADPTKQLDELVAKLKRPEQLDALIVLTMRVRTIRMNGFKDYTMPKELAELVEFDWVASQERLEAGWRAAEKQVRAEFREKAKAEKKAAKKAPKKPDKAVEIPKGWEERNGKIVRKLESYCCDECGKHLYVPPGKGTACCETPQGDLLCKAHGGTWELESDFRKLHGLDKEVAKPANTPATKERVAAPEAEAEALKVYLETGSIAETVKRTGMAKGTLQNWHKRRGWAAKLKAAAAEK